MIAQLPLLCRKMELREMKLLQRLEMKEATEFFNKITLEREVQEKKCEQEKQVRTFARVRW